ncbi:MAG: hypothetical protein ACK42G_04305 [Candidatus Kapaibacteriota bacterium]
MVWFGNIPALIPLTHWGSVYFDNQSCCSVTPLFTITYTGWYRALLQFDRFGQYSVPLLFPLPCPTKEKGCKSSH